MELTIKELAPYLPYGLKVQYEGIINGKEIGDYKRQWNKDHKVDGLFVDYSDYKEPEHIKGLKIGFIKEVRISLKGITYRIGRKGLQTHYSTNGFKPLLRPLSDLTKSISHNGETFVPLVKLFGYSRGTFDFEAKYVNTMASFEIQLEMLGYRNYFFSFRKDLGNDVRIDESFSHRFFCESRDLYQDDLIVEEVKNQHYLFQKLAEWHFDIFNLIENNLAIDINTIQQCPQ